MAVESRASENVASRARHAAAICAIASGAASLVVLLSWVSGAWRLSMLGSNTIPMAPATAASILLVDLAVALPFWRPSSRPVRLVAGLAAATVTVGCLSALGLDALGRGVTLATWLPLPHETIGGFAVAEMSPLSRLALPALGAGCLLTLLPGARHRFTAYLSSALAGIVILIAVTVLLGHAAGMPTMFGGSLTPMALSTSVLLLLTGAAVLVDAGAGSWLPGLVGADLADPSAARSVGTRWGIILISIFLMGAIAGSGFWYLRQQQFRAREIAQAEMSAIADLKVHQIANWRADLIGDATYAFNAVHLMPAIYGVLTERPSSATIGQAVELLTSFKLENQYERVEIFDLELRSRVAIPEAPASPDPEERPLMEAVLRDAKPMMSDLHLGAFDGTVHFGLGVPVMAKVEPQPSGAPVRRPIGVMLFRIDPDAFLFPLVRSWPTSSWSGETVLVRREGDRVVFLNNLRHRDATALRFALPLARTELPAAQAALGREGVMEGFDYRDMPVVAATRTIPGTRWAMVAKMDRAEIYAPFRQLAVFVGLVVGVALVASGLGVAVVWRHRRVGYLQHALGVERHEKELAERIAYLVSHVNDIVLLTDEHWKILEANDRAVQAYGYSLDELKQLTLRDLRAPEALADFDRQSETLDELDRGTFRTEHQRKDGTRLTVESSVRAVELGGARYYQSVIRDITERVRAEMEVRALNQELEHRVAERTRELQDANNELRTFTFSVSHDLKAPLRGMDGYSRLLLDDYFDRLDEEGRFYIRNIRGAATQMSQLIDDLLKYSRIERGALAIHATSPRALIDAALAEREDDIRSRRAEVVVGIDCDLVQVDPDGMRQALRNLIDNALKFTRDVPVPRLEFGSRCRGASCVLWLRDNGCGFEMRHHDRIFEIFQRLYRAEDYPGTGVGLAIVRKAIGRMGGRVWAESAPGQGATFFVEVPR